mmetsp:Transcript_21939/g.45932  ORF Transcript_21939/g.45932 Transcript_21939/m.45932 type:complete len:271 (+) Transcript_21939:56-868(+)
MRAARASVLFAVGVVALVVPSLNFLPGGFRPTAGTAPLAGRSQLRREAPEEPRTALRVKQSERTRNHGGGRRGFTMNRKPVFAYSSVDVQEGTIKESGASVLRRLRVMMDEDHVNMAWQRQQYWRPKFMVRKWRADYNMRLARRRKLRKQKMAFEDAWKQWMRTEGRRMGLTEPVPFSGPKLGHMMTEELDTASDAEAEIKKLPSKQELKMNKKYRMKGWHLMVPEDMLPGQWNDDGEDSVHKLFKRPLHKYPYDIGKRGTNHIQRGIVY